MSLDYKNDPNRPCVGGLYAYDSHGKSVYFIVTEIMDEEHEFLTSANEHPDHKTFGYELMILAHSPAKEKTTMKRVVLSWNGWHTQIRRVK